MHQQNSRRRSGGKYPDSRYGAFPRWFVAGVAFLLSMTSISDCFGQQVETDKGDLQQRVTTLETQVAQLQAELIDLKQRLATPTVAPEENSPAASLQPLLNPETALAAQMALRPTEADYQTLFQPEFAKRAFEFYDPFWGSGELFVRPNTGQTQLRIVKADVNDIRAGNAAGREMPGGYKKIIDQFKDDNTIYSFKFLAPGEDLGMSYTGLIHVNGHWRLFPKLWRVPE